jgi:hypothetical protein
MNRETRERLQSPPSTEEMRRALELKRILDGIPAVSPARAAEILGVTTGTIYRMLAAGELESLLRQGGYWVSVRSLVSALKDRYGPTVAFNVFDDLFETDGTRLTPPTAGVGNILGELLRPHRAE